MVLATITHYYIGTRNTHHQFVCIILYILRVFGSYNIVEFDGNPSLEQTMLSMATNLLLKANTRQTIGWNIQHQFTVHNFQSIISNS